MEVPLVCLTACFGEPTVNTLNRFSKACHLTAGAVAVSGLTIISIATHSDLSQQVKAGACAAGAALILATVWCCRLSTKYAVAAATLDKFAQQSSFGGGDPFDDF